MLRNGIVIGEALCQAERMDNQPDRSLNCQKWRMGGNHKAANCIHKVACARCGKAHRTFECDNNAALKCANCGGAHSASDHKVCSEFKRIQEQMWKEQPETTYKYYPTQGEPYTWEQAPDF